MTTTEPLRVLLVGGGSGFVGRALVRELRPDHPVRSVHRREDRWEREQGVEWIATDLAAPVDWKARLQGVGAVVNVAWHRTGPEGLFRPLCEGLEQMLAAAVAAG
ncbi:MAG TPA: NAD(P)H-binding protein, partial [Thermoplasmata archaeon]|nr:NAD(P)H-binding protein [Thermoplasmata archaeon]